MLIGEIGGTDEEQAAQFIKDNVHKPVAAFIAGRTAPPGRAWGTPARSSPAERAAQKSKLKALEEAGCHVAESPAALGTTMAKALGI